MTIVLIFSHPFKSVAFYLSKYKLRKKRSFPSLLVCGVWDKVRTTPKLKVTVFDCSAHLWRSKPERKTRHTALR